MPNNGKYSYSKSCQYGRRNRSRKSTSSSSIEHSSLVGDPYSPWFATAGPQTCISSNRPANQLQYPNDDLSGCSSALALPQNWNCQTLKKCHLHQKLQVFPLTFERGFASYVHLQLDTVVDASISSQDIQALQREVEVSA